MYLGQSEVDPPFSTQVLLESSLPPGTSFFFSAEGDLGVCAEGTWRGDSIVAPFCLSHLVVLRALEGVPRPGVSSHRQLYA